MTQLSVQILEGDQLSVEVLESGITRIVEVTHEGPRGARGATGASAYQIAVDSGFTGTEVQWLASLQGEDGASAYEVAVSNGFTGSEEEWLASLGGTNLSVEDRTDTSFTLGSSSGTGVALPPATETEAGLATADHVQRIEASIQEGDPRLEDAREWTAETVPQAAAEAGTSTARWAWTPERVFQAIAAWWTGSAAAAKLAGIAPGATANATNAELRDRSTHTGTQAANTITGLAPVATSGSYADLAGRPALGTAAALDAGVPGGVTPLDEGGRVPSAYLPGYVDDVLEFDNFAAFPPAGEAGKIYVAKEPSGKLYRWSGSTYIENNPSPGSTDGLAEGSVNLYFTAGRALSAVTWSTLTGRPGWITGSTTYGQGFLGLVDQSNARTYLGLGSAATTSASDYATAAQGALADSAIQEAAGSTGWAQFRTASGIFGGASGLVIDPASGRLTFASFAAGEPPSAPSNGFTIYAASDSTLSWIHSNGFVCSINGTANTANRSYVLPNSSGTLALASDITAANASALPTTFAPDSIPYAAQVTLDMQALTGLYRTISLAGNLELLTSNRGAGRNVTLRLICDGTQRSLTVPAGWVFLGSKPANIAASKTGVLSLSFFGPADSDCIAAWGVQS